MFRKTTLLVLALATMLVVPQAQAAKGDWMVDFNGGIGLPISDFKDAAKLGFMGGVGFGYGVTDALSVGVDGTFGMNDGSDDLNAALTAFATALGPDGTPATGDDGTAVTVTGKFNILQGGAHGKYVFPMSGDSKISPYALVGLGIYNFKAKTESSVAIYEGDGSENKVGGRGGLGFLYKASENVGVGLEGTFHLINTEDVKTKFIGVHAVVSVGLSKAQ